MSSSDQDNDQPASFMLCPMGLSRGNVTPMSQGTEAKVAGLEQTSGGAGKGCFIQRQPLPSKGQNSVGSVIPREGHTQGTDENELGSSQAAVCATCGEYTQRPTEIETKAI